MSYVVETFTEEEGKRLGPYVTNLDRPVFALRNLPEVTKGALFARYSRSPKSLRRLLLDEFLDDDGVVLTTSDEAESGGDAGTGAGRASALYDRVLSDYGDDSVAQLGFAHLACEQVSNLLTKVIERGRLASYLEQSTRYIPFDDRLGGRWRYLTPGEIGDPALALRFEQTVDSLFETYARLLPRMVSHLEDRFPREPADPEGVWRRTIRAKALDALRGLLPAATTSNVGMAASGQAFESLLLRMRTHPLAEAREYGDLMLAELDQVIPAFVKRMHRVERGGAWSDYLASTRTALDEVADRLGLASGPAGGAPVTDEVTLVDWDPDAEAKIAAACLYPHATVPDTDLLAKVRSLSHEERASLLRAAVGDRANRRHRPGRGFERADYRFDIVSDYGAFRDLQRHRILTVDWQGLSPALGYDLPEEVVEAGLEEPFTEALDRSADLYESLVPVSTTVAQYAVCFAYRIRYSMQLNARAAMHLIELRSSPQGHASYRRVAHAMHEAIGEVHPAVAEAMRFVETGAVDLERLEAERRSERVRIG